jgi:hypothetical protein
MSKIKNERNIFVISKIIEIIPITAFGRLFVWIAIKYWQTSHVFVRVKSSGLARTSDRSSRLPISSDFLCFPIIYRLSHKQRGSILQRCCPVSLRTRTIPSGPTFHRLSPTTSSCSLLSNSIGCPIPMRQCRSAECGEGSPARFRLGSTAAFWAQSVKAQIWPNPDERHKLCSILRRSSARVRQPRELAAVGASNRAEWEYNSVASFFRPVTDGFHDSEQLKRRRRQGASRQASWRQAKKRTSRLDDFLCCSCAGEKSKSICC